MDPGKSVTSPSEVTPMRSDTPVLTYVTNGHKNSAFDQRCPFIQESELGVDQRFNGMGMNEAGWRNGQLIRFMEDKRNVMAVLQHVVAKSCSAQVAFGTMGAY
ncbi:hypothetical protein Tco_0886312 [Tanacetum coccineum]